MRASADAFLAALEAGGPAADRGGNMGLYAWLIGSWELDVIGHLPDASSRRRPGEWHFGWVLQGRAIQDVWIVPPRGAKRSGDAVRNVDVYGTTLRTYDPRIDAWRIQWTDPVTQSYVEMIGRAQGADIVQLGKTEAGQLIRWSFSKIKPQSFYWRGELSTDNGASWHTNVEFSAQRSAAA
jgi:hypothetical protein